MKKIEFKNVKPYQAPKHFACSTLRLHGKEESDCKKFWSGLTHFLPGGGAEPDASPVEKMYIVLEGEVTITNAAKERFVLRKWDSIHIGANEQREILNETNYPASMLVVINYPEA